MKTASALSLLSLLTAQPATAPDPSNAPEENYDFLTKADGRCVPPIGIRPDPTIEAECKRLAEPKRYHGTWLVAFETSIFTPTGKPHCIEGVTMDYCPDLSLEGKSLPWPGRWACARMFDVDFIGRRSVSPSFQGGGLDYRLVVDRLISARRLPDPPFEVNECDPKAP